MLHFYQKNIIKRSDNILTDYSLVLFFYTPWKHQKNFRFSDVFRGYRKTTPGCNGLNADMNNIRNVETMQSFLTLKFTTLGNVEKTLWIWPYAKN